MPWIWKEGVVCMTVLCPLVIVYTECVCMSNCCYESLGMYVTAIKCVLPETGMAVP